VPGLAGIPLTLRGIARSFAVVTGHEQNGEHENWSAYRGIDTLVILMGVARRRQIAAELIASGRSSDQPAAFIERGFDLLGCGRSSPRSGEVAAGETDVASPAVFVVGEVVRQREVLAAVSAELIAAGCLRITVIAKYRGAGASARAYNIVRCSSGERWSALHTEIIL